MRLGLVVYDGLELTTGGYLYDRKLVERWREVGHDVAVVAIPGGSYVSKLRHNVDPSLFDHLAALDVDVLLEDELCHPSLLRHNRRLEDVPIVAVVHHLLSSEPRPAWRNYPYELVERRYLQTVDAFVFNSRTTRTTVTDRVGPVDGVVAPPAGDRLDPAIDPERIVERAHEPGPIRVAFVGSVVPRKGLDTLVRGLARLRRDWELTVVGDLTADPDYAAQVRDLVDRCGVADAVAFEGRVSDARLATRLRESHLLAVPSTYEGFGIVYLEGMGFGLPAVAGAAGGAEEVVTDGDTGFLVPPDDPGAIADRVRRLDRDRDELAAMGRRARAAYEAHPSWTETADRVATFLEGVVDETAGE